MKNALITGISGQDGSYLAKLLLEKGYRVYGTYRRLSTPNFWRLESLNIFDKISLIPCDLSDTGSIYEALSVARPDEIYHLAAQSFVETSFEIPVATGDVSGLSVTRLLESVRHSCPKSKFYFAATSEMFGSTGAINGKQILDEQSVLFPLSPYAAAKVYGYHLTRIYRQGYGLFAVNGILFNHESPLRGLEFVTRKVSNAVAKIYVGLSNEIHLGNLSATRDWGFAPEYVEAMWRMLQRDVADDYVIATGETHSVQELVESAFGAVDLDWKKYVKVDARFLRPLDVPCLIGNYSKAERLLGWKPKTAFKELVAKLVNEDVTRWQHWLKGERFAWDAPSYPSEQNILTRSFKE